MADHDPQSISFENSRAPSEENGLRYAREKLGVAVWKLATGLEGIKTRLADAYVELGILQESDLPPDLVDEWKRIKADLTSGKLQYEIKVIGAELVEQPIGLLLSTLRFMRKKKAEDIARRICALKAELDIRVNKS